MRALSHACHAPESAARALLGTPAAPTLLAGLLQAPSSKQRERAAECVLQLAKAAAAATAATAAAAEVAVAEAVAETAAEAAAATAYGHPAALKPARPSEGAPACMHALEAAPHDVLEDARRCEKTREDAAPHAKHPKLGTSCSPTPECGGECHALGKPRVAVEDSCASGIASCTAPAAASSTRASSNASTAASSPTASTLASPHGTGGPLADPATWCRCPRARTPPAAQAVLAAQVAPAAQVAQAAQASPAAQAGRSPPAVGFAAGWAEPRPLPLAAADLSAEKMLMDSLPPEVASSPLEIGLSQLDVAAPLAVCIQPLLALLDLRAPMTAPPNLPTPQPDSEERMHASHALHLLANCGTAFSGQMLREGALAQLSAAIRMSPLSPHGRCTAPCVTAQPCCVTSAAATTLERLSECLTPGSRRAVMSLHPIAIDSPEGAGSERRWRRRPSALLVLPSALGRAPSLPM